MRIEVVTDSSGVDHPALQYKTAFGIGLELFKHAASDLVIEIYQCPRHEMTMAGILGDAELEEGVRVITTPYATTPSRSGCAGAQRSLIATSPASKHVLETYGPVIGWMFVVGVVAAGLFLFVVFAWLIPPDRGEESAIVLMPFYGGFFGAVTAAASSLLYVGA